ncbi:MAG: hypothetical protein RL148_681 [Planctomycetota bacterium]
MQRILTTLGLFASLGTLSAQEVFLQRVVADVTGTVHAVQGLEQAADGSVVTKVAVGTGKGALGAMLATDHLLRLRFATFDPLQGDPVVPAELAATADNELFVVQYWSQGMEAYRQQLVAMGGENLAFLPNHANLWRMPLELAAAVRALPFVRAVVPYHPAYKLEEELLEALRTPERRSERIALNLLTARDGMADKERVARFVATVDGTVDHVSEPTQLMTVTIPLDALPKLVSLDVVTWVDRWGAPEQDMDIVRQFHGTNYVETQSALRGQGVRVEVMDGGTDTTHPDLQHHVLHGSVPAGDHGTCTTGIVAGTGAGSAQARGVMPEATPVAAYYGTFQGGSRYAHTGELQNAGLPYQCVLQSNSWGSTLTTAYTSISQDMDRILFDFSRISILNSQSNTGTQSSRPQAWAKNVISVGGIRHQNTLSKADDQWNGASIGPAADGRIKPDIASFYDSVYTTDWSGTSGYSTTNYYSGFNGTSAATPIVAGHLGLFYQMWHLGLFGNANAGATVFENRPQNTTAKAVLVNTATQWSFSGSTANLSRVKQGWGHPDLTKMHVLRGNMLIVDESVVLSNLQSQTHSVTVPVGTPELKATMVYRDPAANPTATIHRINNLDLKVTSPSGTVYWGNNGLLDGNTSVAGGVPNTIDTVENVILLNPEAGAWTVEVIAAELNQDSHVETAALDADYALVVSGIAVAPPAPPTPPSALVANAAAWNSVRLDWTDNAANEAGFEVERSLDGTFFTQVALVGANVVTWTDTSVTGSTLYFYQVRAYNGSGSSAPSNSTSATTPAEPVPNAPTGLTATALSSSSIRLNWTDASNNETGFQVERSADNVTFTPATSVAAGTVTWTDTGLPEATQRWYRVRATGTSGTSGWSNTATATTLVAAPSAPTGLTATGTSTTTIQLGWTDNAGNESGYYVDRSADGVTFSRIATLGAGSIAYADATLAQNTTRWYRVQAYNAGGTSAYSNVASATTQQAQPPAAPTGLLATALSSSSIRLNWTDASADETNFVVERSSDNVNFAQVASLAANSVTWTDSGLPANATRWYRVRATNAAGASAWSNVASDTTFAALDLVPATQLTNHGTVSGTLAQVTTADSSYWSVREVVQGNSSSLEHEWTIPNVPTTGTRVLNVKAYQSASTDGDTFTVQYLNSRGKWTNALTVSRTADNGTYQTFSLPSGLGGNLRVRVIDSNSSRNATALDTLYVDHLFVRVQ